MSDVQHTAADAEKAEAPDIAEGAGTAAWANRAEAAEDLGVTRQKLAGMARQGAPLPARGEIPMMPVLRWCWEERERIVGEKRARKLAETIDNLSKRARLREIEVKTAEREQRYVSEAQEVFADSVAKLRRELERSLLGNAAARVAHAAVDAERETAEAQVAAELRALIDAAIERVVS